MYTLKKRKFILLLLYLHINRHFTIIVIRTSTNKTNELPNVQKFREYNIDAEDISADNRRDIVAVPREPNPGPPHGETDRDKITFTPFHGTLLCLQLLMCFRDTLRRLERN